MPIIRSFSKTPLEDIDEFYTTESPLVFYNCLGEIEGDDIFDKPNLIQQGNTYWKKFLTFFHPVK